MIASGLLLYGVLLANAASSSTIQAGPDGVTVDGLRYQVVKTERFPRYVTKYDLRHRPYIPALRGEVLPVVTVEVSNVREGYERLRIPAVSAHLADKDGVVVESVVMDFPLAGRAIPDPGKWMLGQQSVFSGEGLPNVELEAQGKARFAAVFSLPPERAPAKLILRIPNPNETERVVVFVLP